ncbi:MAG: hypothetical protein ACRCVA_28985 [Phreatobacter sp.]
MGEPVKRLIPVTGGDPRQLDRDRAGLRAILQRAKRARAEP